ncbi:ankyrin repeat domain-containing protein [Nocardia amamiensis]|uniref:ankyrin repeat domain-containing protein n=1 Tax=Nocardia amamiensis TaxID=404578 RepID=UPI00082D255E|nr:ankyrin repeat domain-containing protein [Nocardia amamiensis]
MATPFSDTVTEQVADAITRGDGKRVSQLIRIGADPTAIGTDGVSLLDWAVVTRAKDPFLVLLDAGANPLHADDAGDTALHYAAIVEDSWYLDALLARPVQVDIANQRTRRTPVMDAVMFGRRAQVHMLLAAGASPNATDLAGDTPLHIASEIDDYSTVLDLLEAGADPTLLNHQGATFQRYLFMTERQLLTTHASRARDQVVTWLQRHNFPVDQ